MSSPCHIELILSEKEEAVQKEVTIFSLILIPCPKLFSDLFTGLHEFWV